VEIGNRAEKLIKQGLSYTNSRSPDYNKRDKIIKWKKDVYVLDDDFSRNRVAYNLAEVHRSSLISVYLEEYFARSYP